MVRTTSAAVKSILLRDYDTVSEPGLYPFIETASTIITRVNTCAVAKGYTLTAAELELMERWLSAHTYAMSDQPYSQTINMGVGGTHQGRTGMYLEATKYGQMAASLDPSGCLTAIVNRKTARLNWLGKPVSDQIAYEDRD